MSPITRIALLIVALSISPATWAFGAEGHMAIGAIADSLLQGTHAGRKSREILGSSLRSAAVWADCAKGVNDDTLKYAPTRSYAECRIYENAASKTAMERFVSRNAKNCSTPHNPEICHKQYHYTDVAVQRDKYASGLIGTNDHDVVMAITACIAVLQGKTAPAPFKIASKKEALRLLSHYVGDLHQPLHVVSVYLDEDGKLVDPDTGAFDPQTETRGGNDLFVGSRKLHAIWDDAPADSTVFPVPQSTLRQARQVPKTVGAIADWATRWPTEWATDTISAGHTAFRNVTYSKADPSGHYKLTLPADYAEMREKLQGEQIVKAGARLAQILEAIWP